MSFVLHFYFQQNRRNNDSINVLANLNIGLDHDNVMRAPERRQRKFERDRRVRYF